MIYNKKGRITKQKSPADAQKGNDLARPLLDRIEELTLENSSLKKGVKSPEGMFTEDELNEIVNSEVIKALENNGISTAEMSKLTEKIASLEALIKSKEEVISALKSNIKNESVPCAVEGRPVIDDNIVDPSEDINIKAHITVKENISTDDMSDKLSKLKIALGG